MPRFNIIDPPFLSDTPTPAEISNINEWMIEVHRYANGIGIDEKGTLDEFNINMDATFTDADLTITGDWTIDGEWTFNGATSGIDHKDLDNIGSNTHTQIDSHISDVTIHFTEASIDHGNIQGLADDDHTHYVLADGTRDITGNIAIHGNILGKNRVKQFFYGTM